MTTLNTEPDYNVANLRVSHKNGRILIRVAGEQDELPACRTNLPWQNARSNESPLTMALDKALLPDERLNVLTTGKLFAFSLSLINLFVLIKTLHGGLYVRFQIDRQIEKHIRKIKI